MREEQKGVDPHFTFMSKRAKRLDFDKTTNSNERSTSAVIAVNVVATPNARRSEDIGDYGASLWRERSVELST